MGVCSAKQTRQEVSETTDLTTLESNNEPNKETISEIYESCSGDRLGYGYKRIKNPANKATWDALFLELIESHQELNGKSLRRLWDRYDASCSGTIGKPQLKKFLLDWVHVLQRNYINAIDEHHLLHFRDTADERALRAKTYLDVLKRGRVTFADFKRINEIGFWTTISHEVLIDVRLEGIRMWRKIFSNMEKTGGMLSDADIRTIWERYEKKEQGAMDVPDFANMLSDWIEASFVHYEGLIRLNLHEEFLGTINLRAAMAHSALDTNFDGIVEFDEFEEIRKPSFWKKLDHNVTADAIAKAIEKRKKLSPNRTISPTQSPERRAEPGASLPE